MVKYPDFFIPNLEFGTGINKVYIATLPPINLELSLACVWSQRTTLPRLYSLSRRCYFGPVVSRCSGSRAAYSVGRSAVAVAPAPLILCAACSAPWSWWLADIAACWSYSFAEAVGSDAATP